MKKPRLTPWYPGSVQPVRVGMYLRLTEFGNDFFHYWDGKVWFYGSTRNKCFFQSLPWRGIAEKPE